jgi:ABC-2 type transport system ATP-binding protein
MIDVKHLSKHYGALVAVDDISFTAQPGEVLGFLGPNGAGKSTTMRVLAGALHPSAGSVKIASYDVISQARSAKQNLGYLPEGAPLYGELSTLEFLDFIARVHGMSAASRNHAIAKVLERLNLKEVAHQMIDTLSKGYRCRVGLAAAIVHSPKVLILDEPTDGLDPNQKHEVRELIRELAKECTVLLSTHLLEEVEPVCHRVIIIAHGKLLSDTTPQALIASSRYDRAVSMQVQDSIAARAALDGMPGITGYEQHSDGRLYVFTKTKQLMDEQVADRLRQRDVSYLDLRIERGRLEEVFRRLTQPGSDRL